MSDRLKNISTRIHAGLTELRQLAGNPTIPDISSRTKISRATLYRLFDTTAVGHIEIPKVTTFLETVRELSGTPDDIDDILSTHPLKKTLSKIRARHTSGTQDKGTAMVGPLSEALPDPEVLTIFRQAETLDDKRKAFVIDVINGLVDQRKKRKANI